VAASQQNAAPAARPRAVEPKVEEPEAAEPPAMVRPWQPPQSKSVPSAEPAAAYKAPSVDAGDEQDELPQADRGTGEVGR
jgi:hypothetical protein